MDPTESKQPTMPRLNEPAPYFEAKPTQGVQKLSDYEGRWSVLRVLTIIATIFIPLTFVTGVYRMTFDRSLGNMPELGWLYSYALFWVVSIGLTFALLLVFRRVSEVWSRLVMN